MKQKINSRRAGQQYGRRIHGTGHGIERVVLAAQFLLSRLRAVIAEVPDLMRERDLLRAK